jgi:hypothetical protein
MTLSKFIRANTDWPLVNESEIKQAAITVAQRLGPNLQVEGVELGYDDRWYVSIYDAGTKRPLAVSFVRPVNAGQEWYANEIERQLRQQLK